MLKKTYIILVSGIVSVLLGSLFFNSVTQGQKLHTYMGSVRIPILSGDAFISSLSSPPQLPKDTVLPFTFSPEGDVSSITDMWITYRIRNFPENHKWYTFTLTLNDQAVISASFYGQFYLFSIHASSSFYEAITQGINMLKLSDPYKEGGIEVYLIIDYIECFIEYEYQTR